MARRSMELACAVALGVVACRPPESPVARVVDLEEEESAMQQAVEQHPMLQSQRSGSGAPLALVGGGLTGWSSWAPHHERLAATRDVARFQPLSVQYGLEDRELPAGYSVRMESRALAAALDSLGWTMPVDVVAWSFGALFALEFALGSPHRIRTLTIIEPPALWTLPDRGRGDAEVDAIEPLLRELHGEITEAQLEAWARAVGLIPPGVAAESMPQWPVWLEHRNSLRNSEAPLLHDDRLARCAAFTRPVLLVTGTDTAPWLRRVIDRLESAFPDARLLELPAGHAPQIVSIDRFLDALAAFHADAGG